MRLIDWLGVPITEFFAESSTRVVNTPEVIAQHLRADPALSRDAAAKIADIVQGLYSALAHPSRTAAFHLRAARTFKPAAAQLLGGILQDIDQELSSEGR